MKSKFLLGLLAVKTFLTGKWGKVILYGIIGIVVVALCISTGVYKSKYKKLQSEFTSVDSVLTITRDSLTLKETPVVTYDVHLAVSDYSIYQTKCNNNKGTITTPSTKTYVLKVDSSSVAVKEVDNK